MAANHLKVTTMFVLSVMMLTAVVSANNELNDGSLEERAPNSRSRSSSVSSRPNSQTSRSNPASSRSNSMYDSSDDDEDDYDDNGGDLYNCHILKKVCRKDSAERSRASCNKECWNDGFPAGGKCHYSKRDSSCCCNGEQKKGYEDYQKDDDHDLCNCESFRDVCDKGNKFVAITGCQQKCKNKGFSQGGHCHFQHGLCCCDGEQSKGYEICQNNEREFCNCERFGERCAIGSKNDANAACDRECKNKSFPQGGRCNSHHNLCCCKGEISKRFQQKNKRNGGVQSGFGGQPPSFDTQGPRRRNIIAHSR